MRAPRYVLAATVIGAAVLGIGTATPAWAVPVAGQFVPVGIYLNTQSVFGLAYDPVNDVVHYTEGDSGDNLVHTVKPFKDFTAAEIAALPLVDGIPALSLTAAMNDVAGTTNPGGLSGDGGSGAHFSALGFNTATGQLVQTAPGAVRAYDPFTAANQTTIANVGSGFADGLDTNGANNWFSPDVGNIDKNGALFISNSDPSKTVLPTWTGLGSGTALGWSGVEQVGNSLFAVMVLSNADTGQSRTIVRYDPNTGEFLGYDPDGDPVAARWEDLAYDGTYLYAADLRGNAGGLKPTNNIPEPSALGLFVIGASLIFLVGARRRRQAA